MNSSYTCIVNLRQRKEAKLRKREAVTLLQSFFRQKVLNICCFSLSFMKSKWKMTKCLCVFGQKKKYDDVTLLSGELWRTFFSQTWHFPNQTINRMISGLSVMRGIAGCSTSLIVTKLLVDIQLISFFKRQNLNYTTLTGSFSSKYVSSCSQYWP